MKTKTSKKQPSPTAYKVSQTEKTQSTPHLSLVGLGKLGSSYAAFYAQKGYSVIGYDIDKAKVDALKVGKAPVVETDLQATIDSAKQNIAATHSIEEAVGTSDITFIIVPTPSLDDGSFSTQYIENAAQGMGRGLKQKSSYHLFVLTSTVLPLDCREKIIPAIEKSSGKKCGIDFGFCYSPSLIAIGSILKNLREPDFIFLGAFDDRSFDTLNAVFKHIYPERPIERMSIESAELAKISLNAYVTMKITFANTLGEICQHIPRSNVDEVTKALGKDRRIGSSVFRSGLGYGGPCFPRDNFAFAHTANRFDVEAPVALSVHKTNEALPERFADRIASLIDDAYTHIGFLSLAYKSDTNLIDDSHAFFIAEHLAKKTEKNIVVYEPLGNEEAAAALRGKSVSFVNSLDELIDAAQVVFVSQFDKRNDLFVEKARDKAKPLIIIDPWGALTHHSYPSHLTYIPFGRIQLEQAREHLKAHTERHYKHHPQSKAAKKTPTKKKSASKPSLSSKKRSSKIIQKKK